MKKRTLITMITCLFLAGILSSCLIDSSTGDINIPRPADMKADSIPSEIITSDTSTTQARLAPIDDAKTKTVTYEGCAVYAASNEYAFSNKKGEIILIMVSQLPEIEKEKRIKVPDNMLESMEDLEGPPGANPEMVGNEFLLVYDDNDKIIEIRIKE
ncbi:MAG: hypothetical protein ACI94Y_000753 [Maribacter sp.]|jgi:hypothetical protein